MIYEGIKKACDERKITIGALEKMAGLGNGAIYKWRSSWPRVNKLYAVTEILGITIDSLFQK